MFTGIGQHLRNVVCSEEMALVSRENIHSLAETQRGKLDRDGLTVMCNTGAV